MVAAGSSSRAPNGPPRSRARRRWQAKAWWSNQCPDRACGCARFNDLAASHLVDDAIRQAVGPFVQNVAGVPLNPVPFDLVAAASLVQAAPKVVVLDRLLVGGLPAAGLPAPDPFGNALHDVFAVGMQVDAAGA